MNGHPWKYVVGCVGLVMLLHETFLVVDPRWPILMVGLILLGFLPAKAIEDILRK